MPEGGFAPWTGAQARRRDPFRKRIGRATVDDVWGISGKAALVTGAASGIGRATTLALIGAGCRVAALDRDEAGLAALTVDPS